MSFTRQVKRNREKAAHKEFKRKWILENKRREQTGEESMGKAPNLKRWKLMVEGAKRRLAEKETNDIREDVGEDLDWTEESVDETSGLG